MASDGKSEEQRHYESLISFFKWAIGITGGLITVIATTGIIFLNNSVSSLKEDIRNELKDTKTDIQKNVDDSKKELQYVNDNARTTLRETKILADNAVSSIKEDAKNTAIVYANQKVEEVFRQNNIQDLIDNAAQKEIENKAYQIVEKQVRKSNERFMNVLNTMPALMLSMDKIRFGDRNGLIALDSIIKYSKDTAEINLAKELFNGKKRDYMPYYTGTLKRPKEEVFITLEMDRQDTSHASVVKQLKHIILTDSYIGTICEATGFLSLYTGKKFELFDFEAITNVK